jgi:hypothetical protein
MQDSSTEFHKAEYAAIRAEIPFYLKQLREALLYVIIGNATIFAWLSSNYASKSEFRDITIIISWTPFLLSLFGWLFSYGTWRSVRRIADYTYILEEKFACHELGWEHYLAALRKGNKHFSELSITNFLFFIQLLFSAYVGFYFTRH